MGGRNVTEADDGRNWRASADEARNAGTLGDVPLIVLTAGKFVTPRNPADVAEARAFHKMWVNELQPKLARLSSRGRQIIIENSGHGIQFEAPDVLIGAIREIVGESRGEPAKVGTAFSHFAARSAPFAFGARVAAFPGIAAQTDNVVFGSNVRVRPHNSRRSARARPSDRVRRITCVLDCSPVPRRPARLSTQATTCPRMRCWRSRRRRSRVRETS
jgi:hypothetical protein